MISMIIIFLAGLCFADPSWKWVNAIKIVEKHEFYTNNEVIKKPQNSWQTLFAVVYHDSNLRTFKDCVFYRVPGEDAGVLKLKTVLENQKCEKYLFEAGDQEWKELKALQYSIKENYLSLGLTNSKFEIENWEIPLFNVFENPSPKSFMSSAEYRSPKVIFLTPYKGKLSILPKKAPVLEDKKICHDISEDCQEKSPSTCSLCPQGWFEIPNGCPQGPKFCGRLVCGQKNQPACRRGMKYQKSDKQFHCREDLSFAYCSKGLTIHCQGNLPYCL